MSKNDGLRSVLAAAGVEGSWSGALGTPDDQQDIAVEVIDCQIRGRISIVAPKRRPIHLFRICQLVDREMPVPNNRFSPLVNVNKKEPAAVEYEPILETGLQIGQPGPLQLFDIAGGFPIAGPFPERWKTGHEQ